MLERSIAGATLTLEPYLVSSIVAELHRVAPRLRRHVREGVTGKQALELSHCDPDVVLGALPIGGTIW